jgi:protein kinase A
MTVRSKHNLRFYAIKVLNKERVVKMKQVEHTNNEQHMLEAVQHPFIINLWGTFQDTANLYMVMDFVPGGELFTLLRRSNVSQIVHIILPVLIVWYRDSRIPSRNSTRLR